MKPASSKKSENAKKRKQEIPSKIAPKNAQSTKPNPAKDHQIRRSESMAALLNYLVDNMKDLNADFILMNLRKVALVTPETKRVKAAILTAIGRIEATLFNQGCILAYQMILLLEPVITNYHLSQQSGLKLLQKFQSDFEESIMGMDYKVLSYRKYCILTYFLDMATQKKW